MRLIIGLLIVIFAVSPGAETVYKTVDKEGRIIFTDRPSEDSETIKLDELQTIKNPNPIQYTPRPKPPADKGPPYKTFMVAEPADGAGIRRNDGSVRISVILEPGLRSGHKIIITLDGKEVSSGTASSVSLQNIDRGTHNISARVIDGNAEEIISTTSRFSLLRASS